MLIQFLAVGNDQYTRIGIILQNPLGEPHHRQTLAAALGMPNDAAVLLVRQTMLRPLDGIVLIIAADLFDALIEDYKVVDQIKETLFVKQGKKLFFQLVGNPLTVFLNFDINNIAFRRMLGKAVAFPFQIVLLRGKERTIAQALAVVPGHTELNSRKEIFDEVRSLVGQILTDAVGHGHTTLFQFDHCKRNTIHIENDIRTLGVVAYNGDFFRNVEVVFADVFKVNKIYRLGGLLHGLLDLGTVFQQTVNLFVGVVQALLQIGGGLNQGIHCIGCKLFGVALFQQPGMQLLLHDIAVFTVMQVPQICIVQLVPKELDHTVLRFALAVANVGHYASTFSLSTAALYFTRYCLVSFGSSYFGSFERTLYISSMVLKDSNPRNLMISAASGCSSRV